MCSFVLAVFDFKPVMVIKWCLLFQQFPGGVQVPVHTGVSSSKHDNHMKLCGSVSTRQ